MNEQQNNQGNESQKIQKNYENAMQKLFAVFGGEKNVHPKKRIKGDVATKIVEDLLREQEAKKKEEFKQKALSLIEAKVQFDQFVKQEEQKFQKAINDKKKEFTQKVNEVLQIVDGIEDIRRQYAESLKELVKDSENSGEDENPTRFEEAN